MSFSEVKIGDRYKLSIEVDERTPEKGKIYVYYRGRGGYAHHVITYIDYHMNANLIGSIFVNSFDRATDKAMKAIENHKKQMIRTRDILETNKNIIETKFKTLPGAKGDE